MIPAWSLDKKSSLAVRKSGRLILAQRFIAGKKTEFATKSVKRTTDKNGLSVQSSASRTRFASAG